MLTEGGGHNHKMASKGDGPNHKMAAMDGAANYKMLGSKVMHNFENSISAFQAERLFNRMPF